MKDDITLDAVRASNELTVVSAAVLRDQTFRARSPSYLSSPGVWVTIFSSKHLCLLKSVSLPLLKDGHP